MTVGDWLDTRTPPAPAALAARLRAAVGAGLSRDARDAAGVLLATAEDRLRAFMHAGGGESADALALLTVDALVTYAFEAAADSPPEALDTLARAALGRIAALGGSVAQPRGDGAAP